MRERRTGRRHSVRVQVVMDDARSFQCGATIDLGRAGALIEADRGAAVGAEIRVIPLVDTRSPVLEIPARVVRVDRRSGGYRMAIALRLEPEEALAIEELCARA